MVASNYNYAFIESTHSRSTTQQCIAQITVTRYRLLCERKIKNTENPIPPLERLSWLKWCMMVTGACRPPLLGKPQSLGAVYGTKIQ